ncbi:MAG: hypothetical protein FRX49_04590 [Trebouxia sp. A1-2]|nr:MAG: hypothetical protein FRX49_04590 [Trebouxia sp. A1-2]
MPSAPARHTNTRRGKRPLTPQDVMPRVVSHPYNLPEIAIHNSDGASETCQQQHGHNRASPVGAKRGAE